MGETSVPVVAFLDRASQKPPKGAYPSDNPICRDFSEGTQWSRVQSFVRQRCQLFVIVEI